MSHDTESKWHARGTGMTGEEKFVIFASSLGTVFEWYDFYIYRPFWRRSCRDVLPKRQRPWRRCCRHDCDSSPPDS